MTARTATWRVACTCGWAYPTSPEYVAARIDVEWHWSIHRRQSTHQWARYQVTCRDCATTFPDGMPWAIKTSCQDWWRAHTCPVEDAVSA